MQAALHDLTPTRQTNPRPFLICQRVLHRCHEILFGDPPETTRSPYRSLPQSPSMSTMALHSATALANVLRPDPTKRVKIRVNQHALAAFVGMGVAIGAQGMPALGDTVGAWAIMQGRKPRDEDAEGRERVEDAAEEGADAPKGGALDLGRKSADGPDSEEEGEAAVAPPTPGAITPSTKSPRLDRLTPNHHTPHPAQTTPNLSSPTRLSADHSPFSTRTPKSEAVDPFSQELDEPSGPSRSSISSPRLPHQPYHSVPDLSRNKSRALRPNGQPVSAEELLVGLNVDTQRQMLRSHYCRSQIRFLLLLEDISNRLLVVPKPARVPALRAELTSLNHNLPAEVCHFICFAGILADGQICMPLWCAADHSHEDGGETASSTPLKARPDRRHASRIKSHCRVVRISPGDSVVLNSAERAPFLLHVEILEGDLDFDPMRRENRELLKRIVVQNDLKRRKKEMKGLGINEPLIGLGRRPSAGLEFEDFGNSQPLPQSAPIDDWTSRRVSGGQTGDKWRRTEIVPDDGDEMDLVEQLYGAKISVKDTLPELTDALPLPTAPKNKALDVAAWDRGSDLSSRRTSYTSQPISSLTSPGTPLADITLSSDLATTDFTPNPSAPSTPAHPSFPNIPSPGTNRIMSLEDYSERMRTAAVMLAQLSASLVPATPEQTGGSTGGRLSWIPGTGWILGSSAPQAASAHSSPSVLEPAASQGAGGKLKLAAVQAEAIRSRIMEEMMALEEERVARMTERPEGSELRVPEAADGAGTAEDEGIVRRELNKADPSGTSWVSNRGCQLT